MTMSMRAWAPGSLTPSMPIRGVCATRSSGAAGSIRPIPLKPGRPLVAVSSAAVPGTTIQTTSARRTATGTPPTTGTTTLASGSAARFPPEPARSRSRRARAKRPGLSMMSTVGAHEAPDTAAAPVLGDARAPTGAAGPLCGTSLGRTKTGLRRFPFAPTPLATGARS